MLKKELILHAANPFKDYPTPVPRKIKSLFIVDSCLRVGLN